ncbi:hypothetical protein PLICRDRAFT_41302 [Plicaturopsis crispa FD-325 SS-3]|nr:hypothetical protein PLICRDRAFT_41302 [Plicaturopsis crispa FD-325 SS-3]
MMPPRAYVFLGLNGVRILSLIALTLVFASSIFVLVTDIQAVNHFEAAKQSGTNATDDSSMIDCDYIEGSTVPNQPAGVFWAVVNRLLIIFQVIILILSELGWPSAFFDRFFPVLGRSFGVGALGIFQCLLGAAILSHHVDDFSLVSAFFVFALGCVNILVGLIFRESAKDKRSLTSWRAEKKGVLPTTIRDSRSFTNAPPSFMSSRSSSPTLHEKADMSEFGAYKASSHAGYGFGRQGEKAAGLKGFLISRPLESLPRYATRPPSNPPPPPAPAPEAEPPARAPTPTFASSATAI